MNKKGGLEFWKDPSSKNWTQTSVKRLLKRFKDSSTMNRKEGSGQPMSVTIEENIDLIEELICSQEEAPHTHTPCTSSNCRTNWSQSFVNQKNDKRNKLSSVQKGKNSQNE